jgi:CheY-like chemotaxis protein
VAKILVVDDRAEIRSALRLILERAGHEVSLAKNGQEAIDRFQAVQPDLMILDLFMPIMNGFDALFILRQEYPDAKVIAVSGGGSTMGSDALQEAAELGAQMTLQKPIMPTALIEAVSRLLVA